jgi:hypothetical protein
MRFEIIDAKDAPAPPMKKSKAAEEAESVIKQLGKGKVAQLEPDDGQTMRGLRVALGRAAKGAGIKLQTWSHSGYLYVKLLD